MKKLVSFLILFISVLDCAAQFRLSGQMPVLVDDTLRLNIPLDYGLPADRDILILAKPNGGFELDLGLKEKKLATLNHQGKKYFLLLSPGKNLWIQFSSDNMPHFSGTAAAENAQLQDLDLLKIPHFRTPDFITGLKSTALDSLEDQVIKPWLRLRNRQLSAIAATPGMSVDDKLLLSQEIKANAIAQLSYFARRDLQLNRTDLMTYLMHVYREVSVKPDIFPAGPLYYDFADTYLSYLEAASYKDFLENGSNTKRPMKYYGVSIDSSNTLVSQKGRSYLNWLAVKSEFDPRVAEAMLARDIARLNLAKDLSMMRPLIKEFKTVYPKSKYRRNLEDRMAELEHRLNANRNNSAIQILEDYGKVSSIHEVIKRYKGKVVYLDIWGTWCAPCRYELGFNPQLKSRFKDKGVVFLYLDMDEDDKDGHWKEFISVNQMTGLHLRKNRTEMQKFWEELQPDKSKQGLYPSYFIFDRNGQLVPETAGRPSHGEDLYKQLERYLFP